MRHPELLIIPLMMLSDYFLTVWGAVLSEKKYQHHFKIEHYELNPLWQKSISQKKWFNPKHLAIVAVICGFCFLWSSAWVENNPLFEGYFGFLTILFASVIGTHVANILTFSYVIRHPESVSGEIKMSHPLLLCISQFRVFSFLFALILMAVFSPTPFILGGLCSQIVFLLVKLAWLKKANNAERKRLQPKNL
jgi:hypothetical protein